MSQRSCEVSSGKFCIGLVFLLSAGIANAQRRPNALGGNGLAGTGCREIAVRVEDYMGAAIMGATVVPEGNAIPVTTDPNGMAQLPCRAGEGILPKVNVTAQGFIPATATLTPDSGRSYEIRLDRAERISQSSGSTVNVGELSRDTQKKSSHLQGEAAKALAAQKYDSAEMLLIEAQKLTPSSASILNNLGIVAMHRKDLDAAEEYFKKAAESAPRNGEIKGNLGLVLWMQHRQDESYSSLVKASSFGYESNAGNYIMGVVGLGKGECKESVKLLKKVPSDQFPYRDTYLSIALRNCGANKAAEDR
jgi:tetratricopeptide (TPR) repeat protein